MDKIICLVGESGSGKSTMAELLEKDGYNYIQSYTTREPRYEGEKGHIFVRDGIPCSDFEIKDNKLIAKENVIAYTYFDKAHYWATKEQYKNKGISIYIVDPVGVKALKEKVKDAEIIVIYLRCDCLTRIERMYNREGFSSLSDTIPEELYRKVRDRVAHDRKVFKIVQCDYSIDTDRPINTVLEDIKSLI